MAALLFVLAGCLGIMASLFGAILFDLSWSAAFTLYMTLGIGLPALCFAIRLRPTLQQAAPQSA
ncbi:hypothetical protein H9Q16_18265 [Sulfitobacter sp. TSTF-M16]|uniref:Uncharacterized protein n=1 Tax=Sulfitobacter aestuariivivens TaxID=2766981 RepID=A0A927D7L3_9RHOB|nr:hypothetical protein [Sulfitobacter aestuariivivens]MBD3665886.1 hypothetical protein [Sulfitobacter aestuariivivens]